MQLRKPPLPALTVKLSKYNVDDVALGVCKTGAEEAGVTEVRTSLSEKKFELWRKIKFLILTHYNPKFNNQTRRNNCMARARHIEILGHNQYNMTIPRRQPGSM